LFEHGQLNSLLSREDSYKISQIEFLLTYDGGFCKWKNSQGFIDFMANLKQSLYAQ